METRTLVRIILGIVISALLVGASAIVARNAAPATTGTPSAFYH